MSTLLVPVTAPAFALAPDKNKIWSPPNTALPKTASVPGRNAAARTATGPSSGTPDWVPPKAPSSPPSGSAVVKLPKPPASGTTLPGSDSNGSPASGPAVQAAALPVWLASVAGDAAKASKTEAGGTVVAEAFATPATPVVAPVRVEVADPRTAASTGVQGAVVSLTPADKGDAVKVRLGLDIKALAPAFGGDWAQRATLASLPACALTTPEAAGCLERTPVPSHYDAKANRLVADVDLPASGPAEPSGLKLQSLAEPSGKAPSSSPAMVLAAEAPAAGGAGTYSATPLPPSQAWTSGGSSGSFTYSYPVQSPPTLGGSAPQVSLAYDSASVDGRTSSTNAQASWIGDGWDSGAGFVERSYKPCAKAGIAGSGDQCWGGANLTMSLGGHSGELVPDDASCVNGTAKDEQSKCTWRLKGDDGTKVEFLTGATNGTWNGSYLKVTDTSGTVYYFGLNHLPSATGTATTTGPDSGSAWTVPVYSPNAADPCYDSIKGNGSWCQSAWRWNLDYVVDTHGNLTTYTYTPETNYYARGGGQNKGSGTNTAYTRAGVLASIGYGQRLSDQLGANGTYKPASKILFDSGERCVTSTAACDPAQRTTANAANWPDAPLDKQCQQSGTCSNYGPSYWSTKWLNSISTQIRSGNGYRDVDTYALKHVFKQVFNSSENTQVPWLASVQRTGKDNANGQTPVTLPAVTFSDILLPNRVDGLAPARPSYFRPRMDVITTETGGTIGVDYYKDSCSRDNHVMPTSADDNKRACFNVKWYETNAGPTANPVDDWFLRYPVKSVTVDPRSDLIKGALPQTTSYTYGDAAWHRTDGQLVDAKDRTWDQFRGFASVTTVSGSGADGAQSQSSTTFYQGMDGDITASGSARSRQVSGPMSGQVTDSDWLSGGVLESDTYAKAGDTRPIAYSFNTSSGPVTTATHKRGSGLPDLLARYASTSATSVTKALKADGSWRSTAAVTNTDASHGNRVATSLSTADGTPDICARTSYATGGNPQMLMLADEILTVSGPQACTATPTEANTLSGSRLLYDGAGFGSAQQFGEPTGTQVLDRYNGDGAIWTTVATSAFDEYGRAKSVTDPTVTDSANPNGAVTTSSYGAASAGELPNQTLTGTPAPAGAPDAGGRRTSTVALDPARALPLTSTDANGRTVSRAYDSLGRLTSVWTPGRSTADKASYAFAYAVNGSSTPSHTTSSTLRADSSYAVTTQIMDGLGRVVQTQSHPAISAYHGRIVSDVLYDSQGRAAWVNNPYYNDLTGPSTTRFEPDSPKVPNQTYTIFDGLGRPTATQFRALGVAQSSTTTAYPGVDRTDVTPPTGATATSAVTDARGRTTQLWQYKTPTATGNGNDADIAKYTYTPGGQRSTLVDAAGNTWSYGYDQRGRQVTASDPDTGTSTLTYDSAGRLASATDARGQSVATTYDLLGRKTGTYGGSVSPANQLTGYTYDTVAKGMAASSTRYVGGAAGAAYTSAIVDIDAAYRPTTTTATIPGSEIGQTAPYTYTRRAYYDPNTGAKKEDTLPTIGDVYAETVAYTYETYGLLSLFGKAGGATYDLQSDYDAYGRNIRSTMNPYGTQIVTTNTYDEPTGRLLTRYIDKQTSTTGTVQNTTYAYNQAGQITAIRTIPNNTPSATDLQCFSYDYLGRLTTAWSDTGRLNTLPNPAVGGQGTCANSTPTSGAQVPARTTVGGYAPYWQDYSYDLTGNRTRFVQRDPGGDSAKDVDVTQSFPAAGTKNTPTTSPNTGGGTGGPHALLSSREATGWNASDTQYDAAGNTTEIKNADGNRVLGAGTVIRPGESIRSHSVQLTMQRDGNLVLSSLRSGQVVWSSNTAGHANAWATMQDDGNFVVYDSSNNALWESRTWAGGGSGYFAVVQDDGNFTVYAPGWQSRWSANTWNAVDAANGASFTWDVEGKVATLTQGSETTTFVYDADGNQLIRRNPGKTTINLDGDELTYDTNSKTLTGTRYYLIPGGTTLVRQGAGKLTYQLADHHGTSTLSIDANTLTESRRPTDPFGDPRATDSNPNPWAGDKGYVGGLKDGSTGFTNLGARQYDAAHGRFISPDPVLVPTDSQQWNAYAYSSNDPVNLSDPSGLRPDGTCGGNAQCQTPDGHLVQENWAPQHGGDWSVEVKKSDQVVLTGGITVSAAPNFKKLQADTDRNLRLHQKSHHFGESAGSDYHEYVAAALNACHSDKECWHSKTYDELWGMLSEWEIKNLPKMIIAEGLFGTGQAGAAAAEAKFASKGSSSPKKTEQGNSASIAERPGGACNSFPPGTLVLMADGSGKPIEDVRVGDLVVATDPEGSETAAETVQATIVTPDDRSFTELTLTYVNDERSPSVSLTSTQHHPFWDETTQRWTDASDLHVGDELRSPEGHVVIVKAIRSYETPAREARNLTVAELHTYYVLAGNTPVLVHNTGPGCGLFPNTMPGTLDRELALADRMGVTPSGAGSAGFDSAVSSGTVKWAVREDGSLVVMPKFVNGQEISHSALTRGAPVRAAGEADIAGSSGDGFFGLDINNHSGHFLPSSESLQIGRDAFAAAGVHF
ncbi:polymorphic toxin-type HINT domain-containing protein [Kitasatospora sp. NPDC050543]|uniref:polymorphic toxin-type HINT domain-containing protein n=1 Tax=Kitasatospora sp. NPDC050543 TaxID=3364054 RepID=UPI00378FF627